MLSCVSSAGAAAKSYGYFNYDARGNITHNRRLKVAGNGGTRYYLYSQSGQLLFSEENGVQTNYIYLGSKLIAEDSQGVTTFVHSDMLGSPVARTNASGTVQSRRHYKPFGETYETPSYDIGYTGHKYDNDLGLSYMQARYYDPVIGRFYSNDPIGFRDIHSFNRYAYANNNPYRYTDPTGKFSSPTANYHKGIRDGQALLSGTKTQQDFVNEAKDFADVTGVTDVIDSVKSAPSGDLKGAAASAVMAVAKPAKALKVLNKKHLKKWV